MKPVSKKGKKPGNVKAKTKSDTSKSATPKQKKKHKKAETSPSLAEVKTIEIDATKVAGNISADLPKDTVPTSMVSSLPPDTEKSSEKTPKDNMEKPSWESAMKKMHSSSTNQIALFTKTLTDNINKELQTMMDDLQKAYLDDFGQVMECVYSQEEHMDKIESTIKEQVQKTVDFQVHENLSSALPNLVESKVKELMPQGVPADPDMKTQLDKCMQLIDEQNALIKDLQIQVNHNDDRIECVERGDHLGTLILEGLKIDNKKSLEKNTIDALSKYSGVAISSDDILFCHRFGPDETTTGKLQQILIRFANPKIRMKIMKQKQKFRKSPLYLREMLTTKQSSISRK